MTEPLESAPETGPEVTSPAESESVNPAWQPILEQLPAEFHKIVTPHLKELDDSRRDLDAKYNALKPYEELAANNVPVDYIRQTLSFYNAVDADPKGFYEYLGNQLGITPQQAAQVVKDAAETEANPAELDENDPVAKQLLETQRQLAELQSRQGGMESVVQQEAERIRNERADAELSKQISALQEKHGASFNTPMVLHFTQMRMQATGKVDLNAGYQDYLNFAEQIRNQATPNDTAPTILPGAGGYAGSTYVSPADMDVDQKAALFKQMLDAAR